jgi:hypothetical protein
VVPSPRRESVGTGWGESELNLKLRLFRVQCQRKRLSNEDAPGTSGPYDVIALCFLL